MTKHTPGPWVFTEENNGHLEIKGQKRYVAMLFRMDDFEADPVETPDCEQAEANARLIAAAPELLDGVKELVEWLEMEYPESLHQKHFDKWYKLIAKAEGSTT